MQKSNPRDEKRKRVKSQFIQANSSVLITCSCNKTIPIRNTYRCFYCGEFYCPMCAREHFGERPSSDIDSELV